MSTLRYTGGPKIRASAAGGQAAGDWLFLPLPTFNRHMKVERQGRPLWKPMRGGTQKLVTTDPPVYRIPFGYEWLDLGTAEALVAVLQAEAVDLVPRTRSASDADHGPTAYYPCRVLSPVPESQHLTRGYEIEIELETVAAPVADVYPCPVEIFGGASAVPGAPQDYHVDLGPDAGTVTLDYSNGTEPPDSYELIYEGVVVLATGPVSLGQVTWEYPATGSQILTVRVIPDVDPGTLWDFRLSCPV